MAPWAARSRLASLILVVLLGGVGSLLLCSPAAATESQEALSGMALNEALTPVAKAAAASVVHIVSARKSAPASESPRAPSFHDPFFRRFFGEAFERRFKTLGNPRAGSGVIATADGYILTTAQLVQRAVELTVVLPDKRRYRGTLVGADPKTDLAVLKIEAADLPAFHWGDSSQLQIGEVVLAVGNPLGVTPTVTLGVISVVGRANASLAEYEDFMQTDAAMTPGNAGGALVNLKGELIGITTALPSRSARSDGDAGLGFALPGTMAQRVMESLIKQGKVMRGLEK